MEYARLGTTDIEVSRICVGGMSFGDTSVPKHGWCIGQPETEAVIKYAFENGINFFDTANVYAQGTSEEFIGQSLKNLGLPRDEVVLQSKLFFNEGHLSKEAINREIDASLARLKTDYLDVYMIHRFDYDTPIEETMEALHELVKLGKVRSLGASEMYAYQLHNMQNVALENGWTPFTNMQCHYSLLYRENERELIPLCRQFGMAITPFGPLASGHLTRPTWDSNSVRSQVDPAMKDKYDEARELDMPIIERVAQVAEQRGLPMSQIAVAWHFHKGIESPTLGFSKPSRIDDAIAALDVKLSPEEIALMEESYRAHELVGPLARPGEKSLANPDRS